MKFFARTAMLALGFLVPGSLCNEALAQGEAARLTEDQSRIRAYAFNVGWTDPTIVLSVAFQF